MMLLRKRLCATGLSFVLLFAASIGKCQMPVLQKKAMMVKRVIERNHYNAKPVDDTFSEQLFNAILKDLDDYKLYFTQQEITTLQPFSTKLDDELLGKSWGFTTQLVKTMKTAEARADAMATALLQQPFSFTADEYFNYGEQRQYPQNDAEYKLRWTRYLKFRVLSRLLDGYSFSDTVKIDKAKLLAAEPAIRKKILDKRKQTIAKDAKDPNWLENKIAKLYLQHIATTFDPHTDFFPPEDKQAFDEQLSTESMDFGFTLEEDESGDIKVGGLVPGGAAWKSGNIHNDDKLVQIKPKGETPVDVKNAGAAEIAAILETKSNKEIEVTVRSADGSIKNIALQRQAQRNDDNIVKGFLLNGIKKIGYISLPSFYYQMPGETGTSCANDVAKEIVKLKKENIDGLVLDLRYNGGGSMQEAIEMSGIFIDAGPVLLVRGQDKKTSILKDPNRGTIYDGPMAVMINGQSASASEMVAGTLQDYNRAIIVGSNSFGKATMQGVMPMDTTSTNPEAPSQQAKEWGYVKTTMGKLFRVTGNTAQLNGVKPDISLPDAFEAMEYTERSMPFALPSDTVMKQVNYQPLKPFSLQSLAAKSQERIAKNTYFSNLSKTIAELKKLRHETRIPLQMDTYLAWKKKENLTTAGLENNATIKPAYTVANSAFDNQMMNLDSYQKQLNQYVTDDLADDKYVNETYQILTDLIQSLK